MTNQWHTVLKLSKFSDKQQEIVDYQLKSDLQTQFTKCVNIQTPLSSKPLSTFCSPETEKLSGKMVEELSPLDDIYLAEDKQQYQVQTVKYVEQSLMIQALQKYKCQSSELFLPINEIIQEQNCSGFWHLKILTKRFHELRNYNNSKEFANFCLKILYQNLKIHYNDIILQADGTIRLNPLSLLKTSEMQTTLSETINNLLRLKRVSSDFEIFSTLLIFYEKNNLEGLISSTTGDFNGYYFKQSLVNKLLTLLQ